MKAVIAGGIFLFIVVLGIRYRIKLHKKSRDKSCGSCPVSCSSCASCQFCKEKEPLIQVDLPEKH